MYGGGGASSLLTPNRGSLAVWCRSMSDSVGGLPVASDVAAAAAAYQQPAILFFYISRLQNGRKKVSSRVSLSSSVDCDGSLGILAMPTKSALFALTTSLLLHLQLPVALKVSLCGVFSAK